MFSIEEARAGAEVAAGINTVSDPSTESVKHVGKPDSPLISEKTDDTGLGTETAATPSSPKRLRPSMVRSESRQPQTAYWATLISMFRNSA